jgi:NAD(P)-dependent dehydrogenase (short-subunit alcohol dehydrogenase family)
MKKPHPFQRGSGMRLKGKVALITGASGGIGGEAALLFAAEGAQVVLVDVNEAGQALSDRIQSEGREAHFVRADVARDADCALMVDEAERIFGKLDVLFNNAGIMDPADDDAVKTPESVWEKTMAVNLKGVFLGCKHGIPALLRAGGGSVINTASFVAHLGAATPQLAYTASKGGVLALTRELAVIHARQKIRVNALSPGPLKTELLMKFLDTDAKKAAPARAHPHGPLRRGEGDGEGRAVPGLGRLLVHDRCVAARGRRDHGGVRDA